MSHLPAFCFLAPPLLFLVIFTVGTARSERLQDRDFCWKLFRCVWAERNLFATIAEVSGIGTECSVDWLLQFLKSKPDLKRTLQNTGNHMHVAIHLSVTPAEAVASTLSTILIIFGIWHIQRLMRTLCIHAIQCISSCSVALWLS